MASRPTRRPPPRPTQGNLSVPGVAAAGIGEEAIRAASDPAGEVKDLLAEFSGVLDDDPSLDADTKAFLKQQFGFAMKEGEESPNSLELLEQLGDRRVWAEAVESMQGSGAISERDASDLMRQLDAAIAPLQARESKLAIEFSCRLQSDGEEAALAWFREQIARDETEAANRPAGTPDTAKERLLRTEVTQSRSRRLRGPPRLR